MAGNPSPPQWSPNSGGAPPGYPQGYAGAPVGAPKKGMPTWLLVLIILGGLFVVGGGVMASLAIYGVRKYIAASKTVEGLGSLRQINLNAIAAFEEGSTNSRGELVHRMCPSASATVPASIASVKAAKYQSTPADWNVDEARHAGFSCLKFSMSTPQYFLYRYTAHGSSKPNDTFEAEADGDLAGDGNLTTFRTTGKVTPEHTLEVTAALQAP
jgi:type IV pilus assembly protein PilA